jgi:bacillithiol biosynthesis deacetylase BshB1
MKLDVLAFGAHPDDVELGVGGTLVKLAELGYRTGVVDMSRGELGSRGTPQIRAKEAQAAAKVMKLTVRENLKLGDGAIFNSETIRLKVVERLRKYRPELVLTHYWDDQHPDHIQTSQVVTDGCYLSGLAKIKTPHPRFRPKQILYYRIPHSVCPSFLVDITKQFEKKMEAIRCYKSQLHDPQSAEPQTYLSLPEFLPRIEAKHRYYGYLLRSGYAEAFFSKQAIALDDPVAALVRR